MKELRDGLTFAVLLVLAGGLQRWGRRHTVAANATEQRTTEAKLLEHKVRNDYNTCS